MARKGDLHDSTTSPKQLINQVVQACMAIEATGCAAAGDYLKYAQDHGYTFVEPYNWSSSAGDWIFMISKDNREWRLLFQTNNYPRPGFSWEIGDEVYYGTAEQVAVDLATRS